MGTCTHIPLHIALKLNMAKCNLGKVDFEAMLVSSFSSYARGGPMLLAGAARDLQFVAKCFCNSLLFVCHFVPSHPSLPPSLLR